MKRFLNWLAIPLLLINGIGALFGGWNLMTYPDGSSLQISTDWLRYSPFSDFLIPGIILFTMNGICSFIVIITLAYKYKHYPLFVIGEGVILLGWILIQIILLREFNTLHLAFGSIGFLLILCGRKLRSIETIQNLIFQTSYIKEYES